MSPKQKHTLKNFEAICRKAFRVLERDFGFRVLSSREDFYGVFVTYQNRTTAVRVSFEWYDGGIFVFLSRLVNGKVPDYPKDFKSDSHIDTFDFEDLLNLRALDLQLNQPLLDDLFKAGVLRKLLCRYATLIREYAQDVLQGDFGVFQELQRVVKKRAKSFEKMREEKDK